MNLSARRSRLMMPVAALSAALLGGAGAKLRASHAQGAANGALTFRVSARFGAQDMGGGAGAEQSLDARVMVKGRKVRVETRLSDRPVVLLLSPPYVYRLLPNSKVGVRYHIEGQAANTLSTNNLAAFVRNPAALRAALKRGGAKFIGPQTVGGQKLDVYTASQFGGRPAQVKAWLRHADALPARLVITSRSLHITASWRDYRKNAALSDSLFGVPAGYRVREAQDNSAPL